MLNQALRVIRTSHDISQKDLAARLEIAASYLSEIESGKKEATLALVSRYSSLFDIPRSSILFLAENLAHGMPKNPTKKMVGPKVEAMLNLLSQRKD